MYKLFGVITFMLSELAAYAQTDWALKTDKDSIKIYNRKEETSRFNELKVETYLQGQMSDLIAILLDVDNHKQWAYGTKYSYVLKKISPSDIYFYKEIKSPAPVSNRDLVARMTFTQNPQSKMMTVKVVSDADYMPPKDHLVRVPVSNETWLIKPVNDHLIKVEYYLQIDPGGSLSPFLVNLFATKGPYESFRNLRVEMAARKSLSPQISFVKD
jgi:hypothetical protein